LAKRAATSDGASSSGVETVALAGSWIGEETSTSKESGQQQQPQDTHARSVATQEPTLFGLEASPPTHLSSTDLMEPPPRYMYGISSFTDPRTSMDLRLSFGGPLPNLDRTGQLTPPDMKSHVAGTLSEDESCLCLARDSRGSCVIGNTDFSAVVGRLSHSPPKPLGHTHEALRARVAPSHSGHHAEYCPTNKSRDTPSTDSVTESSSSDEDDSLMANADRKRVLLKRLMTYFYTAFSALLPSTPYTQRQAAENPTSDDPVSGPQETAHGTNENSTRPRDSSSTPNFSRPRQRERDDDEDENPKDKRTRVDRGPPSTDPAGGLACPFFKKNPHQYRHWRSCPGPGWPTVHRIKSVSAETRYIKSES